MPETQDTKRTLAVKLKKLTQLIQESNHTVILTGAGISTSAGIPGTSGKCVCFHSGMLYANIVADFRGPHGIWTAESSNKKRKRSSSKPTRAPAVEDFSNAQPTLTHRAICKLVELGQVQYCITQNVDGLHRRSGLTRNVHSVLHGCVFTEICSQCKTEHFRDYDVGGMSFQPTGRHCEVCGGALQDILLDWEDDLPEEDFRRATDQCEQADLVICLGTSLRIEPAGSLPTYAKKFVIVNLQETPYDQQAALIVRAPVDDVMNEVLTQLGHSDWDDTEEEAKIERLWKSPGDSTTNDDNDE